MMFFISLMRPKNMRHGGKPGGRRELMVGRYPVAYGRLRKKSVGRSRNELAPAATRNHPRAERGFVDKGWTPRSMVAWATRQRRHESTMALLKTKPAVKNVVFDVNTPESVPNSSKERHLHTPHQTQTRLLAHLNHGNAIIFADSRAIFASLFLTKSFLKLNCNLLPRSVPIPLELHD
ncbi:hypothetical protein LZ31DRAFT_174398 [Colletotrichum somersetense]|nr:hypothetical protein LZ31DRAFT_174398 [Colletotrichum somersetense]